MRQQDRNIDARERAGIIDRAIEKDRMSILRSHIQQKTKNEERQEIYKEACNIHRKLAECQKTPELFSDVLKLANEFRENNKRGDKDDKYRRT